jgi:hypothetical protein
VKLLKTKKTLALAAVMVAASGGTAMAVLAGSAGGAQLQMQNRSNNAASVTSSTVFNDLPGAGVTVTVPAGASQLINARFTAETQCTRALPLLGGSCSARIVAQRVAVPAPAPIELSPVSGLDYAIDSVAGGDQHEGHAMERSARLATGTYVVKVQRAVTSPAISFTLDDWHLAVEKSA